MTSLSEDFVQVFLLAISYIDKLKESGGPAGLEFCCGFDRSFHCWRCGRLINSHLVLGIDEFCIVPLVCHKNAQRSSSKSLY
jgi:hypothetical protein